MTDITDPTAPAATPQPAKPNWRTRPIRTAIGVVIAIGLIAIIYTLTVMASTTPLQDARASVLNQLTRDDRPIYRSHATIGDDGHTLLLDGAGTDSDGISVNQLGMTLGALDISDAVITRMEHTRALDGMQTGEWGDYAASWTYHPENGLDVIITDQ